MSVPPSVAPRRLDSAKPFEVGIHARRTLSDVFELSLEDIALGAAFENALGQSLAHARFTPHAAASLIDDATAGGAAQHGTLRSGYVPATARRGCLVARDAPRDLATPSPRSALVPACAADTNKGNVHAYGAEFADTP
jgi:hypothetical protein